VASGAAAEWQEMINDVDGSRYYFNVSTGETAWEIPAASTVNTETPSQYDVSVTAELDDPGGPVICEPGWEEFVSVSVTDYKCAHQLRT